MATQFGYGVLFLSFVVSLYAIGASVYGYFVKSHRWVESARYAMALTFPLVTLSAATLIYLIVSNRFDVEFVYSVTDRSMPLYLKITALWGGQAGSLVFWAWLMAAFASAVTVRKWDRDREFLPWVIVVTSFTMAFFVALIIFYENPFIRFWNVGGNIVTAMFQPANSLPFTPNDGQGLNPLLRHPGMIIHPPLLYLGFVSFVIPYAFAIAALITGRTDDRWIRITRRWTLVAWLFLSLGLVLGGRWAYDVLGWGGYWGWDPVEIAAFNPWLTGTAFVHSVMIQEKRGMLKHWNMLLIILTYDLVLLGTFLTRSGVLSSVHAFAQSAIGPAFFIFIGLTFVVSVGLLIYRWEELKSEAEMKSMLSREALFLLNNLLFMGVLVICVWGILFPLISELFTGQKVTVGPPFYERSVTWLFAALMLLMGIAPLSAWGHSTAKTLGRALWKPGLFTLAVVAVLGVIFAPGWFASLGAVDMHSPIPGTQALLPMAVIALLGFALIIFVVSVTAYEFWRAAAARSRAQKENFPLALWRLFGRNRRRYGGYLIHISMMLMAIGIMGLEIFQSETQKSLGVGDSVELAGYTIRYDALSQFTHSDGRWVTRASMTILRDGEVIGELYPRYDMYPDGQPMTIPGVRSTLADDLYIVLVNWENVSTSVAPFKIYHNPLVNWLWIGSFAFILGSIVAIWPDKDPEYEAARARAKQAYQPVSAD